MLGVRNAGTVELGHIQPTDPLPNPRVGTSNSLLTANGAHECLPLLPRRWFSRNTKQNKDYLHDATQGGKLFVRGSRPRRLGIKRGARKTRLTSGPARYITCQVFQQYSKPNLLPISIPEQLYLWDTDGVKRVFKSSTAHNQRSVGLIREVSVFRPHWQSRCWPCYKALWRFHIRDTRGTTGYNG